MMELPAVWKDIYRPTWWVAEKSLMGFCKPLHDHWPIKIHGLVNIEYSLIELFFILQDFFINIPLQSSILQTSTWALMGMEPFFSSIKKHPVSNMQVIFLLSKTFMINIPGGLYGPLFLCGSIPWRVSRTVVIIFFFCTNITYIFFSSPKVIDHNADSWGSQWVDISSLSSPLLRRSP